MRVRNIIEYSLVGLGFAISFAFIILSIIYASDSTLSYIFTICTFASLGVVIVGDLVYLKLRRKPAVEENKETKQKLEKAVNLELHKDDNIVTKFIYSIYTAEDEEISDLLKDYDVLGIEYNYDKKTSTYSLEVMFSDTKVIIKSYVNENMTKGVILDRNEEINIISLSTKEIRKIFLNCINKYLK